MCRTLIIASAGLVTLLASSCALPSRAQWSQINQRGLLPVLIDGRESSAVASHSSVKPSEQNAVRVQAVTTPVVVKTPRATTVPGRPGYAYSPHTQSPRVVDVRAFQPGEEVRCPFTGQAFIVPSVTAAHDVPTVARRPERRVDVVSNSDVVPPTVHGIDRLEPADAPVPAPEPPSQPAPPAPEPTTIAGNLSPAPSTPAPATPAPTNSEPSKPKLNLPYGARVAGRPGFVYSPFAGKTQLVDVAGTAPGVVVRCPYTNKMFRVPEQESEEVKPASEPTPQPAPPVETVAAPDKPAPAPEPAPTVPGGALGGPQP